MIGLLTIAAGRADQARAEAQAALDAKDALHRELGPNIDRELGRVSDAWNLAEIALQTERITWIAAHGSELLRQHACEALAAGRLEADWQPGVPLDWAQSERLEALRGQVAQEWLAQQRPAWEMLTRHDDELGHAPRPEVIGKDALRDAPRLEESMPVRQLLAAAHRHDSSAVLSSYAASTADGRRTRFRAVSVARMPGSYAPVRIALHESPAQKQALDAMAVVVGDRARTYEEKVAAISEVETGKSARLLPLEPVQGRLWRIDHSPEGDARAIVCTDKASHILLVPSDIGVPSGASVRLSQSEGRVLLEARDSAIVVAYEDVDAVQQLALRGELARQSRLDGPRPELAEVAREAAVSAEVRIAACRAARLANSDDWLETLAPVHRHELRRDSALATERLAWVAAYGSPALARAQSLVELDAGVREEWLRRQGGWRFRDGYERDWKRVAADGGSNTIHPARTLRDSAPVKALMADAWAHAPDATLAARLPALEGRAVHCAVIARRVPGRAAVQALLRDESPQQKRLLDVVWKERLRAQATEVAAKSPHVLPAQLKASPVHNETDRVAERVQREFGLPAVGVPEGRRQGRLVRVECGQDHRHRAIVLGDTQVHIVSVLPTEQVARLVGKSVAVEKTAGRVKISGLAPEQGLSR